MIRGCLAEVRVRRDHAPADGLVAFAALLDDCLRVLGPDHYITEATRAFRDALGPGGSALPVHHLHQAAGPVRESRALRPRDAHRRVIPSAEPGSRSRCGSVRTDLRRTPMVLANRANIPVAEPA